MENKTTIFINLVRASLRIGFSFLLIFYVLLFLIKPYHENTFFIFKYFYPVYPIMDTVLLWIIVIGALVALLGSDLKEEKKETNYFLSWFLSIILSFIGGILALFITKYSGFYVSIFSPLLFGAIIFTYSFLQLKKKYE